MKILRLSPVFLSVLLLSAHFYRANLYLLLLVSAVMPLLLFVKEPWIVRQIQIMLFLGSIEWIRTLYLLVEERKALGESWMRLAIILGSVALFTLLSALVFQTRSLKEHYRTRN